MYLLRVALCITPLYLLCYFVSFSHLVVFASVIPAGVAVIGAVTAAVAAAAELPLMVLLLLLVLLLLMVVTVV